jgi:FKBP-type peptidyl-prolyl cis-trans isomerase FklB
MFKTFTTTITCFSLIGLGASMVFANEVTTPKAKTSYSIGLQMGNQVAQIKDEIDLNAFIMGLEDSFHGNKPQLSKEEVQTVLTSFQQTLHQKQQAKIEQNLQEGQRFLAENKTKEGVITLASGLQYKIIEEGTGAIPKSSDTVTTHYNGTLINGEVFDSSYERGTPATFPVSGVIKGWTEALQKMKVGAKWQLFIPSELAYGNKGAGAQIGPNTVIIFDIELLEIKDES